MSEPTTLAAVLDTARIDGLIEGSSFGTEGARSLRERTSPAHAAALVEKSLAVEVAADSTTHPQPLRSEDIEPLVRAAAGDDPAAVEELIKVIAPVIARYCRARLAGTELSFLSVDDVTQEACLAVVTALPRFVNSADGSFLPFLYGIAENKVADAARFARQDRSDPTSVPVSDTAPGEGDPEARLLREESGRRLMALVRCLPREQQEIVTLRVTMGLSASETADALGITAGHVRVSQHRAMAKLRALVAADPDL